MTYLFEGPKGLLLSLLSFFGNNEAGGVTLGLKIEGVVILIAVFLLVYLVERKIFRASISVLAMYLVFFYTRRYLASLLF